LNDNYLKGTDKAGYDFEFEALDRLDLNGFGRFITYHNPRDQYQWKRTREQGIDARIEICEYSLDIEFSWLGADYWYRQKWFIDSRIPRFRYSQNSNHYHLNTIVTNRPHNYDSVRWLAYQSCGGIFILSLEELLEVLRGILVRNRLRYNTSIRVNNDYVMDSDRIPINNILYNQ
jgi:hypothetical protein